MIDDYKLEIQGFKKSQDRQNVRYPVEEPEGVNTSAFPRPLPVTTGSPGAVSLTQIEVLDLVSEGPIEGPVSGEYKYVGTIGTLGYDSATFTLYPAAPNTNSRWLRSIFWNEVPIVNNENQYNFQSVNIAQTPGLPNGSLIGLLTNELTISRGIGERLRYGTGFVKKYRILNRDVKAFKLNVRINSFSSTNQTPSEYGDVEETTVQYSISWKALYNVPNKTQTSYNTQQAEIRGKISYGYIQSTRINLITGNPSSDPDFLGWEIKVERSTPDSVVGSVRNQTFIDSLTEVYGDVFTYPNSALVSSRFSAEYFSQIPNRAYDLKLLKVKVPSNYDPVSKQYSNPDNWDGTFASSKKWTDNPAWCFYDLLTNKRYGLGKYISEAQVDKWALYEIAKYCDIMVPDGEGGVEPRFTCNTIITSRDQAYEVINNMASIFRGMTYYFGGGIFAVQDSYKEPVLQFTNADVQNGDFNYASSSKRTRHTVAIVRYNDKNNFYKPAVEYVEDIDGIRKYGIREVELTAYGCTSRGQALRWGRWALFTESLEPESLNFVGGLKAAYLKPGDIFQVFDVNRKEKSLGGRVYQLTNPSSIILDRQLSLSNSANLIYNLTLATPSYSYDTTQVDVSSSSNSSNIRRPFLQKRGLLYSAFSDITGSDGKVRTQVTLADPFNQTDYIFTGNPSWMIEGSGLSNPISNQFNYFRAIGIQEIETHKFAVSAIQFASGKYAALESGVSFLQPNYQNVVPPGPASLSLSLESITANSKKINYSFVVPDTNGVSSYKIYAKHGTWAGNNDFVDSTNLIDVLPVNIKNGSYYPSQNGLYSFRVHTVNSFGTRSETYVDNTITVDGINIIRDVIISSLTIESDSATNESANRSVISTDASDVILRWQSSLASLGTAPTGLSYRVTIRNVSSNNTPTYPVLFSALNVNPNLFGTLTYKFQFTDNKAINKAGIRGPLRQFDAVVEAMLDDGTTSAGGNFLLDPNSDASYNNNYGYDIVTVNNPKVPAMTLTETTPPSTDPWYTDQWISPDGNINLRVIRGSFPSDLAGGYVYYSNQEFTSSEALNIVPISAGKTINKYQIQASGDPMVVPAQLFDSDTKESYMCVSLFDNFDMAAIGQGINVEPSLLPSNVVRVLKRGAFDGQALAYSAWALISFDPITNTYNWVKTSAGIRSITQGFFENGTACLDIVFNKAFYDTNYIIVGYNTNTTANATIFNQTSYNGFLSLDLSAWPLYNNSLRYPYNGFPQYKYTDKFKMGTFTNSMFLGFLYNWDINKPK